MSDPNDPDDKPSKEIVRKTDKSATRHDITNSWELAKSIKGSPLPFDALSSRILYYSGLTSGSLAILYAVAATQSTGMSELGILLMVMILVTTFPVLVIPHATKTIRAAQRRLDRNGYLSEGKRKEIAGIYGSLPPDSEGRQVIWELDKVARSIVATEYWDSDSAAHLREDLDPFDVVHEAALKVNRGDFHGLDRSIKVLRRVMDQAMKMDREWVSDVPEIEAPRKTDLESAEAYLDAINDVDGEDK